MRTFVFTAFAAAAITAIACGGSGTPATNNDDACGKYYDALISLGNRCSGSGTTGTRTDFIALCKAASSAPGTSITPALLSSCADAVNTTTQCSISDLTQCKPGPGTLADGTACGDDSQCASGDCKTTTAPNGQRCGTCVKTAKEGEPCNVAPDNVGCGANLSCDKNVCVKNVPIAAGGACSFSGSPGSNCTSGTYCNAPLTPNATGVCATIPKKGEACTTTCATGLVCTNAVCADRLDVGGACTSSTQCKTGLYCDTTAKTCAAPKIAKLGETCGGSSVKCDTGLTCASSGTGSTCVAVKKSGEACTPTDKCADFLSCINGVCAVNDPGLCK